MPAHEREVASGSRAHRYVVGAVLLALAVAWGLFLLVDVFDVAGLRGIVAAGFPIWARLFSEGHVVEWGQWLCLGVAATLAGVVAGLQLATGNRRGASFWALIGLSAALLLIEDAGNPSHRVSRWASVLLGDGEVAARAGRLPVFVIVAGLPGYAIIRYWRELRADRSAGNLLLGGIGCYAFAGFSSVVLNVVWDFYERAGSFVTETLLRGRLAPLPPGPWGGPEATGAVLMDTLYEESLELLAAGLILAGAVAALGGHPLARRDRDQKERAPAR